MAKIVIVDENGNPIKTPFKEKLEKAAEKAKKAATQTFEWARENPTEATAAATGIIGGLYGLKKLMPTKTVTEKERDRIDHTYYDPRTGNHWRLRRPLTNAEMMEIERAIADKKAVGPILERMGVLAR